MKNVQTDFEVFVLPNLYGDILTDEASQIQGGVGTAGGVNIGAQYAMFEAVHGSAPRMVKEGRAKYADPSSMIKAGAMLLRHIGKISDAERIENALDATVTNPAFKMTGHPDGASSDDVTAENHTINELTNTPLILVNLLAIKYTLLLLCVMIVMYKHVALQTTDKFASLDDSRSLQA